MADMKTAEDRLVERLRACADLMLPEAAKVEHLKQSHEAMSSWAWAWRLTDDEGVTLHIYSQYPVWLLLTHDIAIADVGDLETEWSLFPLETGTTDLHGAVWREYR